MEPTLPDEVLQPGAPGVYSFMYTTNWLQRSNYALDHHDSCVKE